MKCVQCIEGGAVPEDVGGRHTGGWVQVVWCRWRGAGTAAANKVGGAGSGVRNL